MNKTNITSKFAKDKCESCKGRVDCILQAGMLCDKHIDKLINKFERNIKAWKPVDIFGRNIKSWKPVDYEDNRSVAYKEDREDLTRILNLLKNNQYRLALTFANKLRLPVRNQIPEEIWNLFDAIDEN